MLTVKYIDEYGCERLFEASDTRWHSGSQNSGFEGEPVRGLEIRLPDNSSLMLEARKDPVTPSVAYVMNEKGATVASYQL